MSFDFRISPEHVRRVYEDDRSATAAGTPAGTPRARPPGHSSKASPRNAVPLHPVSQRSEAMPEAAAYDHLRRCESWLCEEFRAALRERLEQEARTALPRRLGRLLRLSGRAPAPERPSLHFPRHVGLRERRLVLHYASAIRPGRNMVLVPHVHVPVSGGPPQVISDEALFLETDTPALDFDLDAQDAVSGAAVTSVKLRFRAPDSDGAEMRLGEELLAALPRRLRLAFAASG